MIYASIPPVGNVKKFRSELVLTLFRRYYEESGAVDS